MALNEDGPVGGAGDQPEEAADHLGQDQDKKQRVGPAEFHEAVSVALW